MYFPRMRRCQNGDYVCDIAENQSAVLLQTAQLQAANRMLLGRCRALLLTAIIVAMVGFAAGVVARDYLVKFNHTPTWQAPR
jgi:hypothetical protein